MIINKCKQCRSTKRGTHQLHQESLILHNHTWTSSGRTWAQGEQASREWKSVPWNLSQTPSVSLNPIGQILRLFHWSGCSSVTSVQDVRVCHWNIPLFISAPLPCCCYIYLCCCQSFRCQFAQNRTDTNCRAIISLKDSFSSCALL